MKNSENLKDTIQLGSVINGRRRNHFLMPLELINERKRKTRNSGISGREKTTNEKSPD